MFNHNLTIHTRRLLNGSLKGGALARERLAAALNFERLKQGLKWTGSQSLEANLEKRTEFCGRDKPII